MKWGSITLYGRALNNGDLHMRMSTPGGEVIYDVAPSSLFSSYHSAHASRPLFPPFPPSHPLLLSHLHFLLSQPALRRLFHHLFFHLLITSTPSLSTTAISISLLPPHHIHTHSLHHHCSPFYQPSSSPTMHPHLVNQPATIITLTPSLHPHRGNRLSNHLRCHLLTPIPLLNPQSTPYWTTKSIPQPSSSPAMQPSCHPQRPLPSCPPQWYLRGNPSVHPHSSLPSSQPSPILSTHNTTYWTKPILSTPIPPISTPILTPISCLQPANPSMVPSRQPILSNPHLIHPHLPNHQENHHHPLPPSYPSYNHLAFPLDILSTPHLHPVQSHLLSTDQPSSLPSSQPSSQP